MKYLELFESLGITKEPRSDGWLLTLCPIHSEHSPSFSANVNNGYWKCWSACGEGFSSALVEKMRGCTPEEAREYVRKYVSNDSEKKVLPFDDLRSRLLSLKSELLREDVEEDTPFYMDTTTLVKDRWPNWWLTRGFDIDDWVSWDVWYDSRTGDAVIPVRDMNGVLRGEIRRRQPGLEPRYMYPREFARDRVLFGENRAMGSHHVYLTEGSLDTIWMWHCGLPAMAILGSSMSKNQHRKLVSMGVDSVTLVFDGDAGGRKATMSVIKDRGIMCDVVVLPDGRDPQDIKDPVELRRLVEQDRISSLRFALGSGERI